MSLDLANFGEVARNATKQFWSLRAEAHKKQKETGKLDQGERGAVTSGKNMDGFLSLIVELVRKNGLKSAEIHQAGIPLTLPGYFRPTKRWDVLIINKKRLVAALEMKSQVGPSFGNNFNNRTEEALGTAIDLRTAFEEGAFGDQAPPFVGWMMMVEDSPESRKPVNDKSPHFALFKEFKGASYLNRYDILCKRIVQKNLYSAASVLTSQRSSISTGDFSEQSEATGLRQFVASFAGHIAAEASR